MSGDSVEIVDATADNLLDFGVCGYKNIKREGYPEKVKWLKDRFVEGLKLKILYSSTDGTQGMIEYVPGQFCWRPVDATGYMFIHCIFSGFKRAYKGKGYGSQLLHKAIEDAQKEHMYGVAVVTRKGSFMADKDIFINHGFEIVDTAPPDFTLLVKRFNLHAPKPQFKKDMPERLHQYTKGLTIIRADQCPYTVKNVREIIESAETLYGLQPQVVDLSNAQEAQNSPCPFGTFCIIYDGAIIAHHPISNTRFKNIMNKIMNITR
jgi:GNAT superfamily N-acetyltransferase